MEAANYLYLYKRDLKRRVSEFIDLMLKVGEDYAINALGHIETGETLSSILAYRHGRHGVLLVGGNAIWIEFGTGVVANGNASYPHPKARELGMNAIGTYIAPYPINKSGKPHGGDPNGWWYQGDDGEYHHTYGIPSDPFFYNTAKMLRKEYANLAKEIFSK